MSRHQELRFWVLFVALLGFLMLWPVALELSSRQLWQLAPGIVREILLLSFVLAVSNRARLAIVVLALGIGLVISRGLFEFGFGMLFDNISHVLGLVIVLIVAVAILSEVLRAGAITLHLVVGAVCVYLMLALLWTFVYDAINTIAPGAILVRAGSLSETAKLPVADANFVKILYFSLTTITTLGNSDVPVTFFARQLAPIEAITGQLYLAVLIARLVGFSSSAGPSASQTGPTESKL